MTKEAPEGYAKIGRLALRQEGGNWNAYWAREETMDDAAIMGSIRMNLITGKPERRQAFLDLMRECMNDLIEDATGHRPGWTGEEPAPEHERAGSA